MLAACTLTRTWPAATSGSATSLSGMLSMVSYCSTTTAFMLIPDACCFERSIAGLPVAASAAPAGPRHNCPLFERPKSIYQGSAIVTGFLMQYRSSWMTEELDTFRDQFRKFLAKDLAPHAEKWRSQKMVDRSAWRGLGEMGALLPSVPEEYGGVGGRLPPD